MTRLFCRCVRDRGEVFPRWALVFRVSLAWAVIAGGLGTAAAMERVAPTDSNTIQLSYAPVVRDVSPAVVNIYTRRVVRPSSRFPMIRDPFFRRFLGDRGFGKPRERVQNALGSGVIVGASGVIVTNYHVVDGSDEITVALSDRREFAATIVGSDEGSDLAVLQVDVGDELLPSLPFGDSDRLEVGDLVLAIGNPYGVGQTVTSGIVSALARSSVGISDVGSFIQTDAAINPGNSGGALVTHDGRLVGINTAIFSRSGGSVGIGFAIPSNLVQVVLDGILAGGRAVRPWMGLKAQAVTAEIAESLGMARPRGVLVTAVHPASPAGRAGLAVGDVVLAVDSVDVFDPQGFRFRIVTHPIGGAVPLQVRRKGRDLDLEVPLIAAPETPPRDIRTLSGKQPLQGAVVGNLSPAFAEELGLDTNRQGVLVLQVEGGAAARLGIRPGDIVTRIDGVSIKTTEQLAREMSRKRATWRIVVDRGGEELAADVRS